jgi:hypothetical protein
VTSATAAGTARPGPPRSRYGGPTLLTDEATRLDLAQALVAYLASAQNQTQFAAPADVLPLLDTWATGGGNTGPGSCAGTNHTFDDAGASFDREGPVITWGAFPATDPFVRGSRHRHRHRRRQPADPAGAGVHDRPDRHRRRRSTASAPSSTPPA